MHTEGWKDQENRLREGRLRLGLTQAGMAAKIGVSLGWYALVEREPAFLSERVAARAAAVLGIPIQELRP